MNFKKISIVALSVLAIVVAIESSAINRLMARQHSQDATSGGGTLVTIQSANSWLAAFQAGEKVPNQRKAVFFSKNAVKALIASHQQDIQANGIVCAPVRMPDGSLNVVISAAFSNNSAIPAVDNEIAAGGNNFANNALSINAFVGASFCPTNCGLIGQ